MTKAYVCRVKAVCSKTGTNIDTLFAFFGPGSIDFSSIADEVQNSLKGGMPLPDAVILGTYGGQISSIVNAWQEAGHEKEVLESRGVRFGVKFLKEFSLLTIDWRVLSSPRISASVLVQPQG